ncbi:hypothetical protein AFAEC_1038 [Aliarcobacter faecis]|uniref:hypothetical protein n=1 Tax=Aliarcobacter faecis TaxID=1564138 RepID=UPI00047A87E6|nr:hypothetical protein [Aliarcobacter faecis]QKF73206.1 hypothetical protein AFAEC_1038 [Aliarcobacter faecis]
MIKLLISLSLLFTISFADNLYKEIKGEKMSEVFNIKEFKEKSPNGEDYFFTDKDGFKIEWSQYRHENEYAQRRTYPKPSFLSEYKEYDENGKIKRYQLWARGYFIKELHFDKEGNIVKTINADDDYKIQLGEVLDIFKKEFPNIDLHRKYWKDKKGTYIKRKKIDRLEDIADGLSVREIFWEELVKEHNFYGNDINNLKFPMQVYVINFFTEEENDKYLYINSFVIDANSAKPLLYVKSYYISDWDYVEKDSNPTILDKYYKNR